MVSVLSLLVALAIGTQAPAQSQNESPRPARSTARAVLIAANGTERSIPLTEFEYADPTRFDAAYATFATSGDASVPAADTATIQLAGGEILSGAITGGQGERVDLTIAGGIAVRADLERMQSLRFEDRLAGAAGVERAAEGDRIYRVQASGVERIDGAVEGFTEGGVRFHGTLVGTIAIPWRSVAALYVEHLGSKPPRMDASAVPVVLDLEDGSRLAGLLISVRGGVIELNRRGEALRIPITSALQLARDDGSVAFLSSLTPDSSEASRPFGDDLGMVWRMRVDRNVSGAPLRAAGARHPRGIGVHAPSRTTWRLDGTYDTLRGSVAIDDEVLRLATRGSCVFRVLLDGREAFASPVVRAGEPAWALQVDLTGAMEIALVVDTTDDGFAGDRADWLGLVLTRGAKATDQASPTAGNDSGDDRKER